MRQLAFDLSALFVILLLASPIEADWLVTEDGARVETRGEWTVKGKTVVFTLPSGLLTSIRASEVDLDASAVLTERAKNPPPPAPAPAPKARAVMVLTDADIKAASPESLSPLPEGATGSPVDGVGGDTDSAAADSAEEGGEGSGKDSGEEAAKPAGLEIESWRVSESDQVGGVEIFGSLRNRGSNLAAELSLVTKIWDEDGSLLAEEGAFLRNSSLLPGRATSFRVLLPGLASLPTDPVFEVKSRGIKMN
jgi:hypothetical protein